MLILKMNVTSFVDSSLWTLRTKPKQSSRQLLMKNDDDPRISSLLYLATEPAKLESIF